MIKTICILCKSKFSIKNYRKDTAKYCSITCANKSKLGKSTWNKGRHTGNYGNGFQKGFNPWNKGRKFPELLGNNNIGWKGKYAKYRTIHTWLVNNFGKASKCENKECFYPRKNRRGRIFLAPNRYEWANLSKKYNRKRLDWIQLCSLCHRQYDHGYQLNIVRI